MKARNNLPKCGLCDTGDTKTLIRKGPLTLVKCRKCGMVFVKSFLSKDEAARIHDYLSYSKSDPPNPITIKRYKEYLERIETEKKTGQLLDIGFGRGDFLVTAREREWSTYGTEISEAAFILGKKRGLKVYYGELQEVNFHNGQFDVITMFEVIEHLQYPFSYLKEINRILRMGGVLILSTPNFNSLTRLCIGRKWGVISPEHSYYFSCRTIENAFKKTGFQVEKILSKNINLHRAIRDFGINLNKPGQTKEKESNLRNKIERNKYLFLAKEMINLLLRTFKIGDTINVYARKTQDLNFSGK